jgi:hypothetical protein
MAFSAHRSKISCAGNLVFLRRKLKFVAQEIYFPAQQILVKKSDPEWLNKKM